MKKNFLTLTAGLTIAAVVAISCNKEQPKSTATAANTSTVSEPKEDIVFVNSDSLLENYAYFKDVRGKMENKSKKAQVDLTAKGNAFQKEIADYQQNAQTMSADQRAATEQRLARKRQELTAFEQNATSAIANESAAENEKLYEKVSTYLKSYAKKKGYKMVLTYSTANPTVLFAEESLDVTKDVVNGLNDSYKSEKK